MAIAEISVRQCMHLHICFLLILSLSLSSLPVCVDIINLIIVLLMVEKKERKSIQQHKI